MRAVSASSLHKPSLQNCCSRVSQFVHERCGLRHTKARTRPTKEWPCGTPASIALCMTTNNMRSCFKKCFAAAPICAASLGSGQNHASASLQLLLKQELVCDQRSHGGCCRDRQSSPRVLALRHEEACARQSARTSGHQVVRVPLEEVVQGLAG